MEEIEADLLFLSMLLLLTLILSISLRLQLAHHNPKKSIRKKETDAPPKTISCRDMVMQSLSTSTGSRNGASGEEEAYMMSSGSTSASDCLNPGFPGEGNLKMAVTKACFLSDKTSRRQIIAGLKLGEKMLVFSKFNIDVSATTTDLKHSSESPASLYFNFLQGHDVAEPRVLKHLWDVENHQDRALQGLDQMLSFQIHLMEVNFRKIYFSDPGADSGKVYLPEFELRIGDDDNKEEITCTRQRN